MRDPEYSQLSTSTILLLLDPRTPRFVPAAPKVNKAFFQGTDFAKPLVVSCLVEPFFGVGGDGLDAACLGWIHLKEPTLDADVFTHARGRVRTVTGAQRSLGHFAGHEKRVPAMAAARSVPSS